MANMAVKKIASYLILFYIIYIKKIINKKMKENEEAKDEMLTGHRPIPIKLLDKVLKSICKIIIKRILIVLMVQDSL